LRSIAHQVVGQAQLLGELQRQVDSHDRPLAPLDVDHHIRGSPVEGLAPAHEFGHGQVIA
jgi:hypothetical protein